MKTMDGAGAPDPEEEAQEPVINPLSLPADVEAALIVFAYDLWLFLRDMDHN